MIPNEFLGIANHLWQSTLFAATAGLLTLLLRNNRAHVRFCVWLAASLKFLIPFSLLMLVGGLVGRHSVAMPAPARMPVIVQQVNEPFVAELPACTARDAARFETGGQRCSGARCIVGDRLRRFCALVVHAMAGNADCRTRGLARSAGHRHSSVVFGIDL